ncbi:hypothetical protein P261_02047 [Lachnospiraceae bacterium TWA4]|nr:hypothetical protein P261_02047 [Lachnospiraceae bacterium TWA4]
MEKLKKRGILLALVVVFVVASYNLVQAAGSKNLKKSLLSEGKLTEISSDSYESVTEEKLTKTLSSKIDKNKVLKELDTSSTNIISFNKVDNKYEPNVQYEASYNDGSVIEYDNQMEIVSYSNFDEDTQISSDTSYEDILNVLKAEYNIDTTYKYTSVEDDGDVVFSWEKFDSENNCTNRYDSLVVRMNDELTKVLLINRFNDFYEPISSKISEESAKQLALSVKEEFNEVTSCTMDYIKPNFFWDEEDVAYEKANIVRLVYNVEVDNINMVYVDAETGEVIGGDVKKGVNDSGIFTYDGFKYATQSSNLAKTAFGKLGYNNKITRISSELRTTVYAYMVSDDKAYGLYVNSHGTKRTLSTGGRVVLYADEVVGNWHFVFLDACSTAEDTTWANAFKINNHSKRAFLGWTKIVAVTDAYDFCRYFWPETTARNHSNSIRQAAVWAASKVPGSGTTPIRFYGDRNYNGRAY